VTKPLFAGALVACALVLSTTATVAVARDYAVGALKITHPWSRPTPPGAPTAAGYLTIVNTGKTADRLIGVSTTAADKVEIHQMSMAGGVMTMRPVQDGLAAPARGSVSLAPGGYHLMFVGPKRPFRAGDRIPVNLRFERAGVVNVELVVESPSLGAGSMPGMAMPADHGARP
jgi:periplasmic copper chaperone A